MMFPKKIVKIATHQLIPPPTSPEPNKYEGIHALLTKRISIDVLLFHTGDLTAIETHNAAICQSDQVCNSGDVGFKSGDLTKVKEMKRGESVTCSDIST